MKYREIPTHLLPLDLCERLAWPEYRVTTGVVTAPLHPLGLAVSPVLRG